MPKFIYVWPTADKSGEFYHLGRKAEVLSEGDSTMVVRFPFNDPKESILPYGPDERVVLTGVDWDGWAELGPDVFLFQDAE